MWRFIFLLTVIAFVQVGCSDQPQKANPSASQDAGQATPADSPQPEIPSTRGTPDQQAAQSTAQNETSNDVARSSSGKRNGGEASVQQQDPPEQPQITRDTLAGRWILVLTQQGRNFPVALLEFRPGEEGSLQAALLEAGQALPDPSLVSADVAETSAALTFDIQGRSMNFQGTLRENSSVKGTVLFEGGRCDPALLTATETGSLEGTQPTESQGRTALSQVVRSDQPVQGLKDFAAQYTESPLAMTAYEQLFAVAKDQGLTAADVETQASEYLRLAEQWGPRMQQMARIKIGMQLAAAEHLPDVALKHLNEAEKLLTDETAEHWKPIIEQGRRLTDQARRNGEIAEAISQVKQGSPDEQKQAVATLRQLKTQAPFNPRLLHALAEYAQQQNEIDEAIRHYAELVALPMLQRMLVQTWLQNDEQHPMPNRTLAALWNQKHGSTEGLEDYLNEVYEESVYTFVDERTKSKSDGQAGRVLLCELFTGSQCPPCVSADVATGGLEKTYDRSEVIVLRYHEHVPGEDPLVNEDAEARFFGYYNGQGTPTLLLNGRQIPGAGGFMQHVADLYDRLRQRIDPQLQEPAPLRISLQAKAEDGVLSISAQADGPEAPAEDLRLRLALAEEEIHFAAPNGIRQHEMVVRSMPGGPEGIPPTDGTFRFEEAIQLADFKQRLANYLTAYEQGEGVDFSVKPLELDKLHLVAFIQNDATQEVLQAASIPVTGTLEYPALPTAPVDAPKPPPDNPFE